MMMIEMYEKEASNAYLKCDYFNTNNNSSYDTLVARRIQLGDSISALS